VPRMAQFMFWEGFVVMMVLDETLEVGVLLEAEMRWIPLWILEYAIGQHR
jgi:hypothetical protein